MKRNNYCITWFEYVKIFLRIHRIMFREIFLFSEPLNMDQSVKAQPVIISYKPL